MTIITAGRIIKIVGVAMMICILLACAEDRTWAERNDLIEVNVGKLSEREIDELIKVYGKPIGMACDGSLYYYSKDKQFKWPDRHGGYIHMNDDRITDKLIAVIVDGSIKFIAVVIK